MVPRMAFSFNYSVLISNEKMQEFLSNINNIVDIPRIPVILWLFIIIF